MAFFPSVGFSSTTSASSASSFRAGVFGSVPSAASSASRSDGGSAATSIGWVVGSGPGPFRRGPRPRRWWRIAST